MGEHREGDEILRIAVVGDFHLLEEEWELSERAMDDIRDSRPDLVVALGDFGTYGNIGSPQGIEEAFRLLRRTGAPIRPILGNHDLERESGPGVQPKGMVENSLRQRFRLKDEEIYGIVELEELRLLFISTEPQPVDSCHQVQECYVSDRRFAELTAQLERRRGVPVIVFSHAPPIGSALRTVPRTHVRSTNAYLDQNHEPERWLEWLHDFPEIVMWFSAHYHLSHHYEDAHTYRHGTHFFLTGVHGSCTRDGYRQSRLIDVDASGATVRTLDHGAGALLAEQTWRSDRPLMQLLQPKLLRRTASCPIGDGPMRCNGLVALQGCRFIAASEDGFAWEVWPEREAVMGTLHVNAAVRAMSRAGDNIWSAWEGHIGVSPANAPARFVRKAAGGVPVLKAELATDVVCLAGWPNGNVLFADGEHLWRAELAGDTGRIALNRICSLPGRADRLIAAGTSCWLLAEGRAFRLEGETWSRHASPGQVADIESWGDEIALLLDAGGKLQLQLLLEAGTELVDIPLPDMEKKDAEVLSKARLLGLHAAVNGAWIILVNGKPYYWKRNWSKALALDTGAGDVRSLSAAIDGHGNAGDRFAVVLSPADTAHSVLSSRLELWEIVGQAGQE